MLCAGADNQQPEAPQFFPAPGGLVLYVCQCVVAAVVAWGFWRLSAFDIGHPICDTAKLQGGLTVASALTGVSDHKCTIWCTQSVSVTESRHVSYAIELCIAGPILLCTPCPVTYTRIC